MSSARIEIPMDEYTGMKERIEELEKSNLSKDKQIEEYKEKYLTVSNSLEDISSLGFFERVFNWESNKKLILENAK